MTILILEKVVNINIILKKNIKENNNQRNRQIIYSLKNFKLYKYTI